MSRAFTKLEGMEMVGFHFLRRSVDGGIWLGFTPAAGVTLLALLAELEAQPPGHSRKARLDAVPQQRLAQLIRRINPSFPESCRRLDAIRIGTSTDGTTSFRVEGSAASAMLSAASLGVLREMVQDVMRGVDDLAFAGSTGEYGDRLHLWPLE
jgi:hypothetical protein